MISNNYYEIYLIDSSTGSTGNYAKLDCEGIDFSTTFQVADLADISKRKDAISKTISFKATQNNNAVFGNLSNLNRYVDDNVNLSFYFNFDITKDIPCIVYENKVQIFQGTLHFLSSNRDTTGNISYETCIKGYTADFFNIINNKLISDLNFSGFTHIYNIDNIVNSWNHIYVKNGINVTGTTISGVTIPGDGYVYPLIDYGANVVPDNAGFDNVYDYRNFRPAFYLKEYFNALFSQSGLTDAYSYTVTGSTSFIDEFNKCVVPNNDADFSYTLPPGILFEINRNGSPVTYNGHNQLTRDNINNRWEFNHLVTFDSVISGATGQTIFDPALVSGQKLQVLEGINTTINAKINFVCLQGIGVDATITFRCLYRTNDLLSWDFIGEVSKSYEKNDSHIPLVNPPTTLNLSLTNKFEAGSEIAFVLYIDSQKDPEGVTLQYTGVDVQLGSLLSSSQVSIGFGQQAVLVGQGTQNIKQVDFLKSVIQMFNLYVYPDPENPRHIIFIPYNDYYSNFTPDKIVSSALDWTNKIDNSSSFNQTPIADIFNLYSFNFKDDTDYFSKYYKDRWGVTYGDLTLTGTTNGQDKSIDLIFGSTPVVNYNGRNIPYLWELNTDNTKKQKSTVPRLLFYNGLIDSGSDSTFEIGVMALSASSNTYYFSHLDSAYTANYTFSKYPEVNEYTLTDAGNEFVDLTFGNPFEVYYTSGGTLVSYGSGKKNLYDRYYANQIAELMDKNSRIITVTAYLNEIDIQNLDFRTPVYFNSILGNNYFKVLKVEYSNSQTPATITLQTAYIYDTNTVFTGYVASLYNPLLQKTGCGSGYTGEAFYYYVDTPYTSMISQADADALAQNDAATTGQTYINTYGLCVNTGTSFNLGFASTLREASGATHQNYYTNTGTLNSGSTVFDMSSGSPIRNISGYYANSTYYYTTDTTSTIIHSGTTASFSAMTFDCYLVYVSGVNAAYTCQIANDGTGTYNLYKINNSSPTLGTIVKDSTGTSLVADGWYSDGTNSYNVISGSISTIVYCRSFKG